MSAALRLVIIETPAPATETPAPPPPVQLTLPDLDPVAAVPESPGRAAWHQVQRERRNKRRRARYAQRKADEEALLCEVCGNETSLCIAMSAINRPGAAHVVARMLKGGELALDDFHDPWLRELMEMLAVMVAERRIKKSAAPTLRELMDELRSRAVWSMAGAEWLKLRKRDDWVDSFTLEERAAQLRDWRHGTQQLKEVQGIARR